MVGLSPVTHVLEAVAGVFFLGALFAVANGMNFVRRSAVAEGKVVGAVEYDNEGSYTHLFEFVHEGRIYRVKGAWGGSRGRIVVGERVRVRFRPDRPDIAKLDRPAQLFVVAIALGIAAATFAALAAGVAYLDAAGA